MKLLGVADDDRDEAVERVRRRSCAAATRLFMLLDMRELIAEAEVGR